MQEPENRFTVKATAKDSEVRIIAKSLFHRNALQIALNFPYNTRVKNHLKKLDGVKWTRTHRSFYIRDTLENRRRLINHCRGFVWVDMLGLKPFSPESKRGSHKNSTFNHSRHQELDGKTIILVNKMVEYMEQCRYSSSTINTYRSMVVRFLTSLEDQEWDRIKSRDIEKYSYQEFILKGKARSTQNQFINAIKIFYALHSNAELNLKDIRRPRKVRKLPEVLTKEEVARILKCTRNKKHQTLLALIYSSGLRVGEALKLKWTDIRQGEKLIYIRSGKGQKDRRVPLSDTLVDLLEKYAVAYRTVDYIFEGQKGGPYSSRSAQMVLKRSAKAAGIDQNVTLHTLRHSYATHLLESGVGLRYIQEILGHSNPKTTMLYTHISGKRLQKVRSPLEDFDI